MVGRRAVVVRDEIVVRRLSKVFGVGWVVCQISLGFIIVGVMKRGVVSRDFLVVRVVLIGSLVLVRFVIMMV